MNRQRRNGKDGHRRRRHQPPSQSTTRMAITAAAIDWRLYRLHHHHIVIVNGSGKDAIATTTIDHLCCTTTIGSVPLPPPRKTTAILALITLSLALSWMRIKRWGGGLTRMHLICCCHGHRCRRCLCLRLQDDGAKEDGHGNRAGNANIRSWEEVGHYNPICPCTCRQLLQALLYADAAPHVAVAAGPLHVLHIILNLIVASFGGGGC
jgi:hypothetical protein